MHAYMECRKPSDWALVTFVLETDAVQARQAFYSENFDASVVGGLVAELKFIVHVNFNSFQCVHIP